MKKRGGISPRKASYQGQRPAYSSVFEKKVIFTKGKRERTLFKRWCWPVKKDANEKEGSRPASSSGRKSGFSEHTKEGDPRAKREKKKNAPRKRFKEKKFHSERKKKGTFSRKMKKRVEPAARG